MRAATRWMGGVSAITASVLALSSVAAQDAPERLSARAAVRAQVHLVVIGEFPRAWVDPIARALEEHLEVQAIAPPAPLPLPQAAYYRPRRRYRAERLLTFLNERYGARPAAHRVLGLTSRDISTSTERFADWGILGLADLGGRAAVVSSFRMRRRARSAEPPEGRVQARPHDGPQYARRADGDHALWRMTTTAVHEVGHTLGLPHCDETRCIMRDAEGTMATVDAGDGAVGPACRALLDRVSPRSLARAAPP